MNIIFFIFNEILYRPLFNGLIVLYKYIPGNDFGIAVIALTILIKLILYPIEIKGLRSQRKMAEIQPQVKEIQERNKDNKEKQTKEILELYKKTKINPFSSIFILLIQLPILIALYRVFWQGASLINQEKLFYSFISISEAIKPLFLGLVDLSKPNLVLAVLAGAAQFWQTKLMSFSAKKPEKQAKKSMDFQTIMQKEMQYVFPVFTVLIIARLPSALSLYILTTSLFTVISQYFIIKKSRNNG